MKKINSIGYGGQIVGIGMLLMVVLPAIFHFIAKVKKLQWLVHIARFFFCIGAVILLLFAVWLCIELWQDRYLNVYYAKHVDEKLSLESGWYECQACGNRQVKRADKSCNVCGNRFES